MFSASTDDELRPVRMWIELPVLVEACTKALPNTDRREHLASKTVSITYDGRGGSAYRANC